MSPSAAAKRLGVSAKALRLYEEHGLIAPDRTATGWRIYAPDDMARAAEIVALRALGLSVAQVGRVLKGDAKNLGPTLAAHEAALEDQVRQVAGLIDRVRVLRVNLDAGHVPSLGEPSGLLRPLTGPECVFDLPWPWGGERFELRDSRPITFITGPLGSGKTRLAKRIAEALPNAKFLGLERLANDGAVARAWLEAEPVLRERVERSLISLIEDGAVTSFPLVALLAEVEADGTNALVVDMPEHGLDQAAQHAFIAFLRRRGPGSRPVFLLTRSCIILDLAALGFDEEIILCPANHSPPTRVLPRPGAPGYEAVATCLASPEVRKRTEGVIAWRPPATEFSVA